MSFCISVLRMHSAIFRLVGSSSLAQLPILHSGRCLPGLVTPGQIRPVIDQQGLTKTGQPFMVYGFQNCARYASILSNWKTQIMTGQLQPWMRDASLQTYAEVKMNAVYNADSMAYLALGLYFQNTDWHEGFALPAID